MFLTGGTAPAVCGECIPFATSCTAADADVVCAEGMRYDGTDSCDTCEHTTDVWFCATCFASYTVGDESDNSLHMGTSSALTISTANAICLTCISAAYESATGGANSTVVCTACGTNCASCDATGCLGCDAAANAGSTGFYRGIATLGANCTTCDTGCNDC